jgi:hypothetical protein
VQGLPAVASGPSTRTRRWDAVILGGALPGLVAAVRMGMRGARVLVLEEEAAAKRFPGLREPFWMSGANKEGVLGACLRALGVPLIDQRRIESDPVAFQVVLPDARIDVGEPHLCVDEWVAWGLAKPEEARALVRAIAGAAEAERDALLEASFVRSGRRLSLPGRRGGAAALDPAVAPARPTRHARGLPGELAEAPLRLRAILDAQVRALCHLGAGAPSAQARARLLGAPLEGGATVRGNDPWLRGILRRRIESLYGEFRSVPERFRLVSSGGQPGLAPDEAGESGEVWVGRALVLNAPRSALAAAVCQQPPPEPLAGPAPRRFHHQLHLRVARNLLPEAMAPRVIALADPERPALGVGSVMLRRLACSDDPELAHLVVSTLLEIPEPDLAAREAEMTAAVTRLMPFAEGRLGRVATPPLRWDDDAALDDPADGEGWPGDVEVRLGTRQPIYRLERAAVAGLGFEGEILLGWRGGDAIAADLG